MPERVRTDVNMDLRPAVNLQAPGYDACGYAVDRDRGDAPRDLAARPRNEAAVQTGVASRMQGR